MYLNTVRWITVWSSLVDVRIIVSHQPTPGRLLQHSHNGVLLLQCLRKIANCSCSLLFSIHHPNQTMFNLLDHVIVIHSGRTMFQCDTKNVRHYFSNRGLPVPKGENPADWMLTVSQIYSAEYLQEQGFFPNHNDNSKAADGTDGDNENAAMLMPKLLSMINEDEEKTGGGGGDTGGPEKIVEENDNDEEMPLDVEAGTLTNSNKDKTQQDVKSPDLLKATSSGYIQPPELTERKSSGMRRSKLANSLRGSIRKNTAEIVQQMMDDEPTTFGMELRLLWSREFLKLKREKKQNTYRMGIALGGGAVIAIVCKGVADGVIESDVDFRSHVGISFFCLFCGYIASPSIVLDFLERREMFDREYR